MPSSPKKRFIAGAVCPQCQKIDTIVIYENINQGYRACVDCGFQQARGEVLEKPAEQVVQWVKKGKKS